MRDEMANLAWGIERTIEKPDRRRALAVEPAARRLDHDDGPGAGRRRRRRATPCRP